MTLRLALISGLAIIVAGCGQGSEPAPKDSVPASAPASASASATTSVAANPAQTVAAGERPKSFAQCAVCHAVEAGQNGLGPTLAGVFGAKAGHIGDYAYSGAMRESGLVWDAASLDAYLENPQASVPGTKMSFRGMKDAQQRAAIIAYLETL